MIIQNVVIENIVETKNDNKVTIFMSMLNKNIFYRALKHQSMYKIVKSFSCARVLKGSFF